MHENRPELAAFCAPAAAYCGPRRTIIGSLLVVLLPALLIAALAAGLYYALIPWRESQQIGSGYSLLFQATSFGTEVARGQTPRSVVILLGLVLIIVPSLWFVLRKLHHRPLRSLFGASGRLNWRHFWVGLGVVLAASLLRPSLYLGETPSLALPTLSWMSWMLIAVPVLLAQCTTEELFFRGYLQQQLAARFASHWAWLVLPSVLFGLLHYNAAAPSLFNWLNMGALAMMGAMAADVTARTGNLGAAIGLHFGNNLYLLMLHAKFSAMNGLALTQSTPPQTMAALVFSPIEHLIPLVIAYSIYRKRIAPKADG